MKFVPRKVLKIANILAINFAENRHSKITKNIDLAEQFNPRIAPQKGANFRKNRLKRVWKSRFLS